ncbi:ATP-binding protein [Niabella hirudinis]|uniref:DNA polymerase III subunit n=1 Tax=Niabella hirudinis TaxID=1285929 RepID=UPI003EBAC59A
MQFKQVIGQHTLKKELPELMKENRLAHALLFLGKEGSGALSLALAFAQYIVCERASPKPPSAEGASLFGDLLPPPLPGERRLGGEADSCGTCPSCVKAAAFAHPDIHFSYPVVTKKPGTPPISTDYITEWREFLKEYPFGNAYDWLQFIGAENKQGNITAQECNDIIKKLNLKSFESEYKVLVIWLPEYLGNEGNKLLKLIEEPPPNTVFLLVAENESQILATILSRVQLIKVPLLEDKDIEAALNENNRTTHEAAARIAAVSQGNYHTALQMVQHADEDWQELLRGWLNAIMKTGPVAQSKWVDEVSKLGREKQKQFLQYFNHLLQLALKMQIFENAGEGYPDRDRDFAARLNKITGMEQQEAIITGLDNAAYYIERNANSKMLFMALTIKIYHIIKDKIVFLNE